MIEPPLVSVIVPNYNYRRFLPERFSSIFEQTHRNLEIIFIDDASTDQSVDYVKNLGGQFPIRIFINERNSGNPFLQWRRGISEARGQYVWIAEADDSCERDLVARLLETARQHPSAGIIFAQSALIDRHGRPLGTFLRYTDDVSTSHWRTDYFNTGLDELTRYLVMRNTIPNASGCLFARRVFDQPDVPELNLRLCGDWMTYVRICERHDMAFVAKPLNRFRQHPHSVRERSDRNGLTLREVYQVLNYIKDRHELPPDRHEAAAQYNFHYLWHLVTLRLGGRKFIDEHGIMPLAERFDPALRSRLISSAASGPAALEIRSGLRLAFFGSGRRRLVYPEGSWTKIRLGPGPGRIRLMPLTRTGLVSLRLVRWEDSQSGEDWGHLRDAKGYRSAGLRGSIHLIGSQDAIELLVWGTDGELVLECPNSGSKRQHLFVEFEIRCEPAGNVRQQAGR